MQALRVTQSYFNQFIFKEKNMKKSLSFIALGSFSLLSADQYYSNQPNQNQNQAYQGYTQPNYSGQPGQQVYYQDPQSNYNNQQYYQNQPQQQQNYNYDNSQMNRNQQNQPNFQPNNPSNPSNQFSPSQQLQQRPIAGNIQVNLHDDKSANAQQQSAGDDEISKNVQETIYGWFSSGNKNVAFEVNDGVVTLTGIVNSPEEKSKIEDSVKKIKGVKQVNNKINVNDTKKIAYYDPQSGTSTTKNAEKKSPKDYAALENDKRINSEIRQKLDSNSLNSVVIITANGIVTLGGSVDNPEKVDDVISDIEKIEGVKKVNNKVTKKM